MRRRNAFCGRPIAGCANDRHSRTASRNPFCRFAAALTDKANDHRIGGNAAREHREQRRFSNSGCTKEADPRAASERQEAIDHFYARPERRANGVACGWHRGLNVCSRCTPVRGAFAIECTPA